MAEWTVGAQKHREPEQKHSLSITLKATRSSQAPTPEGSATSPGSTSRQRPSGASHEPRGHISPSKDKISR